MFGCSQLVVVCTFFFCQGFTTAMGNDAFFAHGKCRFPLGKAQYTIESHVSISHYHSPHIIMHASVNCFFEALRLFKFLRPTTFIIGVSPFEVIYKI
jgi:hypothetical protein